MTLCKNDETKKMLENLIFYKDVQITHTINGYILTYSKDLKCFQILCNKTGELTQYADIESCESALSKIQETLK
ncbi:hypothetical protein CVD28_07535 [Bacillus sp. M6-12]|nr:hypothetical protein CVD28_07535 [Bacillus sp. M6-12]